MNKSVLSSGIMGALVIASVAMPLIIHHQRQIQSDDNVEQLAGQVRKQSELSPENARMSNRVAAVSGRRLSEAEFSELLKLRGEMRHLRDAAAEADKLRQANLQLALRADRTNSPAELPEPDPQTVQAHWNRDELASAGYGDPLAALKTTLWAMSSGDGEALAASVTTEARSELSREHWNNHGEPAEEIARSAKSISESLAPCKGFSVTGQKAASPDITILDVFFSGEGKTRQVAMSRVNGEWKLKTIGRAGRNDAEQLVEGSGAWP
jgi:hypothetical protein